MAKDEPASEELQPRRQAVELYRGEFLEGFSVRQALGFEEWVVAVDGVVMLASYVVIAFGLMPAFSC